MSVFYDTVYSACSAEFSPFHANLLALGLYQIAPADNASSSSTSFEESPATKRLGRILLFDTTNKAFNELDKIDPLPAVLDMKWAMWDGKPTLAVANAEGGVALYSYDESTKTLEFERLLQYAEQSTLSLSLEWSHRKLSSAAPEIVVSNSSGSISILGGPALEATDTWHAHNFEPWIAAFDSWNTQTIFTGGDDSLLKVWDRRQGFDMPVLQNKRFDAGVTAVQSHLNDEHLLAVGCYDANLRIFDKRAMRRPVLEKDVGGGIWRVKWHPHPSRKDDLLVACMHDGFKVVKVANDDIATQTENREHESMAYGADWESQEGHVVASASFYDHAARLWEA